MASQTPPDLAADNTVALRFQSAGQLLRWPFQSGGRVIEIIPDAAIVVDARDTLILALLMGQGSG